MTFLSSFKMRLGNNAVITSPEEMSPFLKDWRGHYDSICEAVLLPANTEEVAWIAGFCTEHHIPVTPQGGNTGLVGGSVANGGVILSLSRMNKIRSFDTENASMVVEAGCTLAAVQSHADSQGLLFPLSLASEGSCQIGGNLSTNAGGTAVLRYGNARDLVLGLEVVLADGHIWNGLLDLRKNNAGYDLKHLFLGSEGTLGIITAASLKLFSKPRTQVTALIACTHLRQCTILFQNLKDLFGETLTAFEYWPHFGMELVLRHIPQASNPFDTLHPAYCLVELSSSLHNAPLETNLQNMFEDAIGKNAIQDATIASSFAQAKALWLLRESLSEAQSREGPSLKHDVSVPLSKIPDLVERGERACLDIMPDVRPCIFGHLGDGNLHFNLSAGVHVTTPAQKADFMAKWPLFQRVVHDLVTDMHGSIAAEHGIGLQKRDELKIYSSQISYNLMKALKKTLDPENILNQGKVI